MATQFAPIGAWSDLPSTDNEQADILRNAMQIRGLTRRKFEQRVPLDRWEADLLIGEARKVGPVAREALVLLQARAAEWASRKALRGGGGDLEVYAALVDSALETWGQVRDSFRGESRDAIAVLEARLVDLQSELAPSGERLARVVAWPARNSGTTVVLDRAATLEGAEDASWDSVSSATSVMDRDAVLAAVGCDAGVDPSATSVLDRDAVLAAVGYEANGEFAAEADASATSVLNRDAVFAAVGHESTLTPMPNPDASATSVMDRDAVLHAIAEADLGPLDDIPIDVGSVEPLESDVGFDLFEALDLVVVETLDKSESLPSAESDEAAGVLDPIALSLSIDLIDAAHTVDCQPVATAAVAVRAEPTEQQVEVPPVPVLSATIAPARDGKSANRLAVIVAVVVAAVTALILLLR